MSNPTCSGPICNQCCKTYVCKHGEQAGLPVPGKPGECYGQIVMPIPTSVASFSRGTSHAELGGSSNVQWQVNTQTNIVVLQVPNDTQSDFLCATNLGFTVPADSIILGAHVEFDPIGALNNYQGGAGVKTFMAKFALIRGNSIISTIKESVVSIFLPNFYNHSTIILYEAGSSNDMWGASLTPELVNDSDFGVAVSLAILDEFLIYAPECRNDNSGRGFTLTLYYQPTEELCLPLVRP